MVILNDVKQSVMYVISFLNGTEGFQHSCKKHRPPRLRNNTMMVFGCLLVSGLLLLAAHTRGANVTKTKRKYNFEIKMVFVRHLTKIYIGGICWRLWHKRVKDATSLSTYQV